MSSFILRDGAVLCLSARANDDILFVLLSRMVLIQYQYILAFLVCGLGLGVRFGIPSLRGFVVNMLSRHFIVDHAMNASSSIE